MDNDDNDRERGDDNEENAEREGEWKRVYQNKRENLEDSEEKDI